MTSHDTCTSGTFRVLTVASLLWLKIEAPIPEPADCEVLSVIKFLNAQNPTSIENHRHLCQVYGHIRLVGQHISFRSSAGRCLIIILPWTGSHAKWFTFFLTPQEIPVRSTSAFSKSQRGGNECHGGSNPRRQTSTTHDTKVGPTVWQMSQFRWWMCWGIAQHLLFLFQ